LRTKVDYTYLFESILSYNEHTLLSRAYYLFSSAMETGFLISLSTHRVHFPLSLSVSVREGARAQCGSMATPVSVRLCHVVYTFLCNVAETESTFHVLPQTFNLYCNVYTGFFISCFMFEGDIVQ
jgi:hypothetical protein